MHSVVIRTRHKYRLLAGLLFVVCTALVFLAHPLAREETVGEHFRKVMAQIDAECRKEKLGPYLDPKDPKYNNKKRYMQCDILTLKPYDPLATEEGRFAHSIKLPSPHDKPKDVYKPGMTGEEYFKALCEAEAGEWVFRTVVNIDGVFQARRSRQYPSGYFNIVFYTVEKGEMNGQEPQNAMVQPYQGRYEFLEIPLGTSSGAHTNYIRYFRNREGHPRRIFQTVKDGGFVTIPYIVADERSDELRSKYGYTWRGIVRTESSEHGIEGSELVIFEIESGEVMAFRRIFTRYYPNPDYKDRRLAASTSCPRAFSEPSHRFIQRVLVPANNE